MIDTLMVVLTRWFRVPWLRTCIVVSLVGAGIGVLLLVITVSGIRWPGQAATASSVEERSHGPVFVPTPADPSIPIILQNPPAVTSTPTARPTHTASPTSTEGAAAPGAGSQPASTGAEPFPIPGVSSPLTVPGI